MSEAKKDEVSMEYRTLGGTGLKVSRLGLGTMTFTSVEQAKELISIARNAGGNYFDNAEGYGKPPGNAEILFGKALKELQKSEPIKYRRSDLVITTKIFFGPSGDPEQGFTFGKNEIGVSRKHLIEGTNAALERLQLDYVDVIYAHRFDVVTPVLEVVRGFTDVIRKGKAFYWGTSQWPAHRIIEAYWIAKVHNLIPPCVEQCHYNMLTREYVEAEYLPVFQKPYSVGTTIWGSLNAGILTGKYNQGIPKDSRRHKDDHLSGFYPEIPKWKLDTVAKLLPIAEKLKTTPASLAMAWCLKSDDVTVLLCGAKRASQLEDNLKCLAVVDKLTAEVMEEIETVLDNKPKLDDTLYGNYWRT